jgi:hypothetical protein
LLPNATCAATPRPGEEDGVHYNFVEKPAMEAEIAAGKFLEHANVHENIYGTSLASVEKVGLHSLPGVGLVTWSLPGVRLVTYMFTVGCQIGYMVTPG